jgi:hypothetical protein
MNLSKPSSSYRLRRKRRCALLWAGTLLAVVVATAGCRNGRILQSGPALESASYTNPDKSPASIGSVSLIELHNRSTYPEISAEMTDALYQALQKKHVFGLAVVNANDPTWKNLPLNPDSAYTLEQLLATRKIVASDAILVGAITGYQPYPHMSIGLRLKLIDLNDGQLLWALEHVWDTADKDTEKRIKDFYDREIRAGFAPLRQDLAVLSSIDFVKFVAFEVAETL